MYWPFVPQFGHGHVGQAVLGRAALARLEVLDEVVGAEALVALQALHERVGEGRDVTGCLPHALRQDDRRVEAHHVAAAAHERLPPLAADVLLELGAEGAVVPRRTGSAVDLARLEDEPAVAGEGDDFVETGLLGHGGSNGRVRVFAGFRGMPRKARHPSILSGCHPLSLSGPKDALAHVAARF